MTRAGSFLLDTRWMAEDPVEQRKVNHAQVSHGEERVTGESRIVADPAHQ
jgi:hypothetical protein